MRANDAQQTAHLVVQTLEKIRTDEMHKTFSVEADLLAITIPGDSNLPRKKRTPHDYFGYGPSEPYHHETVESFYQTQYSMPPLYQP